jgi:hypothetical protein
MVRITSRSQTALLRSMATARPRPRPRGTVTAAYPTVLIRERQKTPSLINSV